MSTKTENLWQLSDEVHETLNRLWLAYYISLAVGVCGLCANTGRIRTRDDMRTPAGVSVSSGEYWCICPNGRADALLAEGRR